MADRLEIPEGILNQLKAEAQAAAPRECCGLVLGVGNRVTGVVPIPNIAGSNLRCEMDAEALHKALVSLGDEQEVLAQYHSHPTADATPSSADLYVAASRGSCLQVIVGLGNATPVVGAYLLNKGHFQEIETTIYH